MTGRLGLGDDHAALHDAARGWLERHVPREVPRAWLDGGDGPVPALPTEWRTLAADFDLLTAGVVVEELGRACVPGPAVPTIAAVAAVARLGGAAPDGHAAIDWGVEPLAIDPGDLVSGTVPAVPAGAFADWYLLPVAGHRWAIVERSAA